MTAVIHALLLRRGERFPAAGLLAIVSISSACFGAAIGAYVGGLQILYGALKMPLFFLATLGLSFTAMHLFAARELRARRTFDCAMETITTTALLLGALSPVVGLVSVSCPKPSPRAYSFLILLLTASVAAGGIAGVVRLHSRLRSWKLTAGWVVIYQFTGAQMAWLLKPWVSHTLRDDRFLPLRENLNGNFYESVFRTLTGFFG